MRSIADRKSAKLEKAIHTALNTPQEPVNEDDLFSFADYDASSAEKIGYSNYSYWGCTLRTFFKRKTAVILLFVLVILVAFTFIQPHLPGQYGDIRINDYPMSDKFVYNAQPSLHNEYSTVPAGTILSYSEIPENELKWPGVPDEWIAVSGKLATIRRPDKFTILEYGEDWCMAEYKGITGYVKNNFETKLKLPDDPENTPYESRSNYTVTLYASPDDIVNPDANADGWLYAKKRDVSIEKNGLAVTLDETTLYIFPSTYGFLFGTNDRGQDLWARVWSGTRTSLYIGFMVALVEAFVGILVGVLWGYVRKLDRLLTEIYNVLDNIPTTIVLILIAYIMSPSVTTIIFAMCLTRWMGMARFIRNQIIIIRDRDYNVASRCLGVGSSQIMVKNLLPYLVSVIMLRMALAIPGAIGNEVFITYIGLGIPVNTPSLGNLINEGRALFVTAPSLRYQLLFPTIVLSIITISFYIIGNAFADAADPKNHM